MSRYNKDLGDFGEFIACSYLNKCGYTIITQNYTVRGGEIDIIASTNTELVFIEVKTRSSEAFGNPSEAVTKAKQMHMINAAERYIMQNPTDKEIRFDVIEVYAQFISGEFVLDKLNHIENIVLEV